MLRRIRPQKSSSQLAWAPVARAVVLDGSDGLLGLRKDLADRDAQLGAGLQDPHPRLLQREAVLVGPRDEPVEDRIVEGLPPVPVVGLLGAEARVAGFPEALGDGDLGSLIVRSDHA